MAGVIAFILIVFAIRRARFGSLSTQTKVFVVKCVLLAVAVGVIGATGYQGAVSLAPALVLLCVPTLLLQWIVVPLGLPQVAFWTVEIGWPLGLADEIGAGAVMYAALAHSRRAPGTQSTDWLEQRLNHERAPRGIGVVAAGLLAGLRGDRRSARCLLLAADTMAPQFISREARTIARDWLVVDAARIGDWREVARLGKRSDHLRWSYAVARIGERLRGDPRALRDWRLWWCWMCSPRRRATLPLLRRALAVPLAPGPTAGQPTVSTELPDALAGLAALLDQSHAGDGTSFAAAVSGLDARLDDAETRAQIEQRLLALGARQDVEAVVAGFRQRLADLLVAVIEESPRLASQPERGPTFEQAIERVRRRLFGDVEAQCRDYNERTSSETSLVAVLEWQTWAQLRSAAERLLELDPAAEAVLFQRMFAPVNNFAVFQQNTHKRVALAHDMYSWLRKISAGDATGSQLLSKNMRASLG